MTLSNLNLNYLSGGLVMAFLIYMAGCHKSPSAVIDDSIFLSEPLIYDIDPQTVNEASGITDSRINQGFMWVQEDSGNPNRLFLLGHDGKVRKTVLLSGISNRDWEDIALAKGPDPALDYIYIAETGDNGLRYADYAIHRFPEPSLTVDTVRQINTIKFQYPDGKHDAEAILVDDLYKEIYIITKRDTLSKIYRLNAGYKTSGMNQAVYVGSLKFNGVVSACISPDRQELLVKTYADIHYFK
ncbi:MAG: PE-PGRS family protein, partial [Chitinophagaceae bacterium]